MLYYYMYHYYNYKINYKIKINTLANMFSTFSNYLAILISLSTMTGVLVHDMYIDKATVAALVLPTTTASYETNNKLGSFTPDLHTHIERGSVSRTLTLNDLKTQTPRIYLRTTEDKKHLSQKHISRGYHAFDNYHLPIV